MKRLVQKCGTLAYLSHPFLKIANFCKLWCWFWTGKSDLSHLNSKCQKRRFYDKSLLFVLSIVRLVFIFFGPLCNTRGGESRGFRFVWVVPCCSVNGCHRLPYFGVVKNWIIRLVWSLFGPLCNTRCGGGESRGFRFVRVFSCYSVSGWMVDVWKSHPQIIHSFWIRFKKSLTWNTLCWLFWPWWLLRPWPTIYWEKRKRKIWSSWKVDNLFSILCNFFSCWFEIFNIPLVFHLENCHYDFIFI